jgi:hypothetical protein
VALKTKRNEQASKIKDSGGDNLRTMAPKDMKTHQTFEDLLPIDKDTLEEITKKMALYGYYESQPILLGKWPGLDYWVVIDGHTRRRAAIKNDIKKVFYVTREFESESAALEHAMSLQTDRRIIEDRHIFMFIQKYDTLMARGGDRRSEEAKSKPTGVGNEGGRSASARRTASILGCNYGKVEKVRRILKDAVPSIMNAVPKGKMTINQAYNATIEKGRKEEQKLMGEKLRSARIKFREINIATLEELKGDIHEHVNIAVEGYFRYLVKKGKLPKKK